MISLHEPSKQVNYLQQCLSSDKKPLGIFLGAGCPVSIRPDGKAGPPLIPDIEGITRVVREGLSKKKETAPLLGTIEGHFEKDGRKEVTVEDMLSHIRALRAVAGREEVRGLSAEALEKLDDCICEIIHGLADKALPSGETPYHRLANWADAVRREEPVEVFTTNYDLLMEQAFEDLRVPYFDGFAGVRKPFFDIRAMEDDMLPPRWARLWKLHGSINWYQIAGKGVFRGTTKGEEGTKRVIHPSHLKYQESRRMPYLAMVDRFRAFLKKPAATLVLCGYSFRDEHVNEVIVQGLENTPNAIAFALLHDVLSEYRHAIDLAQRCVNLTLLARDGAVIGGLKAEWSKRDAGAMPSDAIGWIKWVPEEPDNAECKYAAELWLGDFMALGEFLQELVGVIRKSAEGGRAE